MLVGEQVRSSTCQKLMCVMGRGDTVIGSLLAVPGRILFSRHRSGLLYPLANGTASDQAMKTTVWEVNDHQFLRERQKDVLLVAAHLFLIQGRSSTRAAHSLDAKGGILVRGHLSIFQSDPCCRLSRDWMLSPGSKKRASCI